MPTVVDSWSVLQVAPSTETDSFDALPTPLTVIGTEAPIGLLSGIATGAPASAN